MADFTEQSAIVIASGSAQGHVVINKYSPLRRLNYFDGKFIRAPDMIEEQQALLNQIRLGNRAGGAGVVHGYDCTLAGNDQLRISAGHAIDPQGRALLMGDDVSIAIDDLITRSRQIKDVSTRSKGRAFAGKSDFGDCVLGTTSAATTASSGTQLYVITLNHTEAYCGEEDVYGKLCSEACTTSTNRSYIIEGVEIRAVPIDISQLYKTSAAVNLSAVHLRSRVASAYFEQERQLIASHVSGDGLRSGIWCLGAEAAGGNGVPIAIIARSGDATLFLDAWTARRERMQAPPSQYWAQRMAMRPWPQFLAHVLQFQCQLRALLASASAKAATPDNHDPCADTRKVAAEAATGMRYLLDSLASVAGRLSALDTLDRQTLKQSQFAGGTAALELQYQKLIDAARIVLPKRVLINGGIVELPSAGYLPVSVNSTVTVNEQVRRLLGEGVDLRFCVVTPDYVPHALEEAQHMERICLLRGLDDAAQKPHVDVLVPNGAIREVVAAVAGTGYQSTTTLSGQLLNIGWPRRNKMVGEAADVAVAPAAADVITAPVAEAAPAAVLAADTERLSAGLRINTNAANKLSAASKLDGALTLPTLTGAARGDATANNGGITFRLAARSQRQLTQATSTLALAEAAAGNTLELLDGDSSRLATARANRLAINSNLSSLDRTRGELVRGELAEASTLVPSTAIWIDMKVSRDPFTLGSGDSTDVQARLLFTSSRRVGEGSEVIVCERSIHGQLLIEKAATATPAAKIHARLVANGVWRDVVTTAGNDEERVDAVRLNESVIIARRPVDGVPPTVSVTVANPSFFGGLGNIQLIVERIWKSPLQSTFRLLARRSEARDELQLLRAATEATLSAGRLDATSSDRVLLQTELTDSADVLTAGNSWHSCSLQALTTLEKALRDKGFADGAQRLLFPPPVAPPAELEVLARLPWVLFHRRREKTCAAQAPAAELPVARRYRVFHVQLEGDTNIARLVAALQSDVSATLAALKPRAVTLVEFAPGNAVVSTAHGDVRADWQARVQGSADLQLALIASEGDVLNDGEALADSRLSNLTNVLDAVSETAAGFQTLGVSEVPDTLAGTEVDGVVVYFTRAVATVCHSVYRLRSNNLDSLFGQLDGYLANPGAVELSAFLRRQGAEALPVNPRFFADRADYFAASDATQLDASWDVADDGPVSHVITLAANGETEAQQLVSRQQASRISQTVGTSIAANALSYRAAGANLLKPCPKATVLITQTMCNDVYAYTPVGGNAAEVGQALRNFIQTAGITRELLEGGATPGNTTHNRRLITHFRAVDFYRGTAQFEATSRDAYRVAWQSELGSTSLENLDIVVMAVARAGTSAAETAANLALAQQQGVALRDLMGLTQANVLAATNSPQVAFPVDCTVLTVVVVILRGGLMATSDLAMTHMVAADTTTASTGGGAAQPTLNADNAAGVRFDANNEVIRDAAFVAAVENLRASAQPVNTVDVVGMDARVDAAAEARANALLSALRDAGVAAPDARVNVRVADERERTEIVRSGFALDRGFVLRR